MNIATIKRLEFLGRRTEKEYAWSVFSRFLRTKFTSQSQKTKFSLEVRLFSRKTGFLFSFLKKCKILSNFLRVLGQKIAIGASGGKDSTVLIHVMKTLNEKYDYGLDLHLLSIDEGITGRSSSDSIFD